MALRRDMLEVIEQGGWLMPGTDPMDGMPIRRRVAPRATRNTPTSTAKSTS